MLATISLRIRAPAGTTHLNRIQSTIFPTAFNTSENMLICAPTGAGKTNCAMLTLLQLIKQHIDEDGVLQRGDLKAVYIAPMKALAQEVGACLCVFFVGGGGEECHIRLA